ncbi:MAG: 50S ribosomal protein L7/L12 [Planctomycetes bacterium]|nr:50S ribosomal protein L7/L12 [Planctomycetota bacterium]MCK5578227.1 50S ribosomal protein L7/L12 [Planctomycetota bacterium]
MPTVVELTESIKGLKDEERNELLLGVISQSSVLWLKDFVKAFEEKFEVTAAMPMMAVGAAGAGGEAAPAQEEKTTFDVVLKEIGANKIQVIKVVRVVTSLGLKEAKALVDGAPQPVKTGLPKEEAEKIKKDLEASGAKIEIK